MFRQSGCASCAYGFAPIAITGTPRVTASLSLSSPWCLYALPRSLAHALIDQLVCLYLVLPPCIQWGMFKERLGSVQRKYLP